jgi:two-component system LytT family response regulator
MQTLEDRLDPQKFMRVHRSMIVRLDLVEALHRGTGGDYEVQLKGGARVKVSRSRREALERWLGVLALTATHGRRSLVSPVTPFVTRICRW